MFDNKEVYIFDMHYMKNVISILLKIMKEGGCMFWFNMTCMNSSLDEEFIQQIEGEGVSIYERC